MPVEPLLGAKWRKAPPLPCWSGEKHPFPWRSVAQTPYTMTCECSSCFPLKISQTPGAPVSQLLGVNRVRTPSSREQLESLESSRGVGWGYSRQHPRVLPSCQPYSRTVPKRPHQPTNCCRARVREVRDQPTSLLGRPGSCQGRPRVKNFFAPRIQHVGHQNGSKWAISRLFRLPDPSSHHCPSCNCVTRVTVAC